jgi:hypothetical protein
MTTPTEETQVAPPAPPEVDEDEVLQAEIITEINELNQADGISGVTEGEDATEAAPVAETPAVAPVTPASAPAVTPPTEPAVMPPADPYVQNLERQIRGQAAQQARLEIEQRAEQTRQDLVGRGVDEATAIQFSNERRQSDERFLALQTQTQDAIAEQQAKMTLAANLNQAYGLGLDTLLRYNDPVSMEQAAKQHREMTTVRDELAAARKASVPAQIVAGNRFSPNTNQSESDLLDSALNKVSGDRTEAENAAMQRAAGF